MYEANLDRRARTSPGSARRVLPKANSCHTWRSNWARKEERGMSDTEREARKEFSDMVFTVLNPSGPADSMADTTAWIKGERPTDSSYWDEKPGSDQQ